MWLTKLFSAPFEAQISSLKLQIEILERDNASLRDRLDGFEADDREIRRSLYTRAGLLSAAPKTREGEPELRPIKKVTPPWHVQAAKLEADSKERYWKKVIEDREALDARVSSRGQGEMKSENELIQEDIEELSR